MRMMRYFRLAPFLGIHVLLLAALAVAGGTSRIIWDAAEGGRFDQKNKGYSIDNSRVVVDLHDEKSLCPTGLGHLASGRDSVKEIIFRYRIAQAGRHWLHIIWHPGGSGWKMPLHATRPG